MDENHKITPDVNPECQWVIDGEGYSTTKWDGTSCMVKDGILYKRYDNSKKKSETERVQKTEPLTEWIYCECPTECGRFIYWIPVTYKDYYHQIGWAWAQGRLPNGTYELIGPEVQGNPHNMSHNILMPHGHTLYHAYVESKRDFESLKEAIKIAPYEGIVWHHPDGRMAKLTKKKFGFPWGNE